MLVETERWSQIMLNLERITGAVNVFVQGTFAINMLCDLSHSSEHSPVQYEAHQLDEQHLSLPSWPFLQQAGSQSAFLPDQPKYKV